jgi:GH15 family glucan-1,4-alpha-glucosidase
MRAATDAGCGRLRGADQQRPTDEDQEERMAEQSLIADHAIIGDLQTAALVASSGDVDWFCTPRFDSPSVFASLLDADRGGRFRIAPEGDGHVTKQGYLGDTAVLATRFMAAEGTGAVIDFMPVSDPKVVRDRHTIVRLVRGVRGRMRFRMSCAPRFDYGRASHAVDVTPAGAVFESGGARLVLHAGVPLEQVGQDVEASFEVREGDVVGFILETAGDGPRRAEEGQVLTALEHTIGFWRSWLAGSTYRGRWREMVNRSAITLKLLTYAPTGALVAAATAGLPEELGGERNWDYRYTWIRDSSFSVRALLGLGFTEEAARLVDWVGGRARESATGDGSVPLKIMYRVDGSSDLDEETLDHFSGYKGSRPVRIGNGAADQMQLDIYGEFADCAHEADRLGALPISYEGGETVARVIDWLCEHWDQPEEGIWETRGGQQAFTYGRVMCWVAFDRAIRLATKYGRPADVERWTAERDAIYRQVMTAGWHEKRRAFVQHYDTDVLDASVLLMPVVGFISSRDPRWTSTLDAIEEELETDSLVYRYDPTTSTDGLRGSEGTFSICTMWYVDAMARAGRVEEARLAFEKMLTYANPVGLFSEEIAVNGEQIGNFPQAFTHLSLINAAITLDAELDLAQRPGHVSGDDIAALAGTHRRAPR